ncbi:hypothetical protein HDU93_003470, partial [Gonapodya sp. JEL0774]
MTVDQVEIWNGVWVPITEGEDTEAVDAALAIQGAPWLMRQAAKNLRPNVGIRGFLNDKGTFSIEVKRSFMGRTTTNVFPVDGSTVESEEPVGKTRVTATKVDGRTSVILVSNEQAADSPAWSSTSEWSVVEENGEKIQYRKTHIK